MSGKVKNYIDSEGVYHCSKGTFNINEVCEYYRTHNRSDTAAHFGVSDRYLKFMLKWAGKNKSQEDKIAQIEAGFIKKYGVKRPFCSQDIQEKIKSSVINKYGVDNVSKLDWVKEKIKNTTLDRYGVVCYLNLDCIKSLANGSDAISKRQNTLKENSTFNTSKPEDYIYNLLCCTFGEDDVIRQYTDDRYPWRCDFYISSKDLFIECNYHWTHGGHPFDKNSQGDLKILEYIKSNQGLLSNGKKNSYYKYEEVWTKKDPEKLNTAICNNLNYIVLYKFNYQKIEENLEDAKRFISY